jgi:S1-C subfamily serine protease
MQSNDSKERTKMKSQTIAVSVLLSLAAALGHAEEPKPHTPPKSGGPQITRLEITGDHYMIQGLGALITGAADTARIQFIPQSNQRPEEFRNVNMETGDLLAMLNGKKVASVKDFEARYEAIVTGADVKIGIKRGTQLVMASFKKPDAANLPKGMQMVAMTADGPDANGGDGPAGDIVLSAAGIGVGGADGKPAIVAVFPPQGKGITGDKPESGDIITNINGTAVATVEAFKTEMDKHPMGSDVTLSLSRKGATKQFTFTRGGGK